MKKFIYRVKTQNGKVYLVVSNSIANANMFIFRTFKEIGFAECICKIEKKYLQSEQDYLV